MGYVGAFAFGVVIGWFAYFTNRYRKGEVQFSDLATLLGVIGGGAVTALFGDAKTGLFGAYGLGLAVGFFAYFAALVVLVRNSGGAYSVTWFLDGRRRKLNQDEEIPSETRPTVAPMSMQPLAERVAALEARLGRSPADLPQAMVAPAAPVRSPLAEAVEERDRAIAALVEGQRELLRRIGDAADDDERARLRAVLEQLSQKVDELVALRLRDILESPQVKAALASLRSIAAELEVEAKRMRTVADAIAAVARMIDRATRVVGLLGGLAA